MFLKCFQNWCPACHSSGFPALKKFSDTFADHPAVSIAAVQTVFEGFRSNTKDAVRDLQLRYDLPVSMGHDPGDPVVIQLLHAAEHHRDALLFGEPVDCSAKTLKSLRPA